jgi:hypothetical protein
MLAAKGSSADMIRDSAKPPEERQPGSEDVDFAVAARGGPLRAAAPAQGGLRALRASIIGLASCRN